MGLFLDLLWVGRLYNFIIDFSPQANLVRLHDFFCFELRALNKGNVTCFLKEIIVKGGSFLEKDVIQLNVPIKAGDFYSNTFCLRAVSDGSYRISPVVKISCEGKEEIISLGTFLIEVISGSTKHDVRFEVKYDRLELDLNDIAKVKCLIVNNDYEEIIVKGIQDIFPAEFELAYSKFEGALINGTFKLINDIILHPGEEILIELKAKLKNVEGLAFPLIREVNPLLMFTTKDGEKEYIHGGKFRFLVKLNPQIIRLGNCNDNCILYIPHDLIRPLKRDPTEQFFIGLLLGSGIYILRHDAITTMESKYLKIIRDVLTLFDAKRNVLLDFLNGKITSSEFHEKISYIDDKINQIVSHVELAKKEIAPVPTLGFSNDQSIIELATLFKEKIQSDEREWAINTIKKYANYYLELEQLERKLREKRRELGEQLAEGLMDSIATKLEIIKEFFDEIIEIINSIRDK